MNNRKNAEAAFHGIGGTITMRVDVKDMAVEDQLSLLHRLMDATGTTAAIIKTAHQGEVFAAIEAAWNEFRAAPVVDEAREREQRRQVALAIREGR